MTESTPNIKAYSIIKGATVLVAALSWNEFAKKFISFLYPVSEEHRGKTVVATLLYAVFVTITVMLVVFLFNFTSNGIDNYKQKKENAATLIRPGSYAAYYGGDWLT